MKPWRTGRKVGRTIYEQQGEEPSDNDVLIGVMDTRDMAAAAAECRNFVAACPEGVTQLPIQTLNDMEARIRADQTERIVAWLRTRKAPGWDYPNPDKRASSLADAIVARFKHRA